MRTQQSISGRKTPAAPEKKSGWKEGGWEAGGRLGSRKERQRTEGEEVRVEDAPGLHKSLTGKCHGVKRKCLYRPIKPLWWEREGTSCLLGCSQDPWPSSQETAGLSTDPQTEDGQKPGLQRPAGGRQRTNSHVLP